MQCKILFFVLFVVLVGVWAKGDNDSSQKRDSGESGSQESDDDHSGNSSSEEDDEDIYNPCKKLDKKCVRNYFLSKGPFTKVSHEDGQPISLKELFAYVPTLHAEVFCNNFQVTFYGTKIIQLYENQKSKKIVISVMFDGMTIESPSADLITHRNGFGSVHAKDFAKMSYPPMNITCEVPLSKSISLKDAKVWAFISNQDPKFEFGPNISKSSNQFTQRTIENFKKNLATATKELFLTKSYYSMHAYLQHYIAGYTYQYSGEFSKCN